MAFLGNIIWLVTSFYVPLLSLIPFFLLISSKENVNYSRLKIFTFLTGLLIIILSETTIRLVSNIIINNVGIALIPLLVLLIIYLIFIIKFKLGKKIQ